MKINHQIGIIASIIILSLTVACWESDDETKSSKASISFNKTSYDYTTVDTTIVVTVNDPAQSAGSITLLVTGSRTGTNQKTLTLAETGPGTYSLNVNINDLALDPKVIDYEVSCTPSNPTDNTLTLTYTDAEGLGVAVTVLVKYCT